MLVVGGLCWLLGWRDFLLIEAPIVWIAGGVGIWLFYVQHQFDHTYWQRSDEWSYDDAALTGSSHLQLPRVLQFFSGNIGLHHVHHLNSKIPNYNLQQAHDREEVFRDVPSVSLADGLRATRLKLWDEDAARLVTWPEVRTRTEVLGPSDSLITPDTCRRLQHSARPPRGRAFRHKPVSGSAHPVPRTPEVTSDSARCVWTRRPSTT